MNARRFMSAVAVLLMVAAIAGGSAAQRSQAQIDLQAAVRTETVDGNLSEAIKQYAAIVSRHTTDRAVVASALVHMAECHQKLGDSESQRIYERIVREFGDQRDAVAIARARLGAADTGPAGARARGDRVVWSGEEVDLFGTVSPDGRYLTYTNWSTTNNTMVRDLVAGTSRALTNNVTYGQFGYSGWSVISRDGKQVAFEWEPARQPRELRLAPLAGTGVPPSRRIRQFEDGEGVRPFDWSPDGQSIAVLVERVDRSSTIGILSVHDGSLKQLKSVDWRGVNKMVFSPDGRYVAYDLATTDDGRQAQVMVLALDGSQERAVVDAAAGNHVMGWAPDGTLVFTSLRSGTLSLWAIPVSNGQATAPARLVKENISSTWSLGLTPSGTLYVWKYASARSVKVARFDLDTGRILEPATSTFQRYIDSRGRPSWSRDGRQLVFISCGGAGGGSCLLFVRATDTGIVREVPHGLRYLGFPDMSPDGRTIVTDGRDTKGRQGIYFIDVQTGATSLVTGDVDRKAVPRNAKWTPDGGAIHYVENRDGEIALLERALGSNSTTELLRVPDAESSWIRTSPDGKLIAYVLSDATKGERVMVKPAAGGEARTVLTAPWRSIQFFWDWTPSSDALIMRRTREGGGDDLWLVPLSGTPRKLDVNISQWPDVRLFSVHPDGRQIAFVDSAGDAGAEVWALENFLSRPPRPSSQR